MLATRVRVPFRDRRALATVVALLEETNAKGIREIEAVIGDGPTLSEPLLELARVDLRITTAAQSRQ